MTNVIFASNDLWFKLSCQVAGISPTSRQASKWRMKKGLAYYHKQRGLELYCVRKG